MSFIKRKWKFLKFYLADPGRIFQQMRYKKFLKDNPGVPWMAPGAISWLESNIANDFKILEWGSGGSTKWFANRCEKIVSVENQKGWYDKVKKDLANDEVENVDYRFVEVNEDIDQIKAIENKECPPYVAVVKEFDKKFFNLVVIDGPLRHICIPNVEEHIAPGGYVLLDNSNWCSFDEWRIPKNWKQVCHDDVGVSPERVIDW